MLSAESAAGQYPREAVATMSRIAEEVETDTVYRNIINAQRADAPNPTPADAIAAAARDVAQNSRRQGDLRLELIPAPRRFASPASVRFRPWWR